MSDARGVSADQTELYRKGTVHHVGGRNDAGIQPAIIAFASAEGRAQRFVVCYRARELAHHLPIR